MESQDTEKNLRNGRGSHPHSRANLRPFSAGGDVRRNVSGRPRTFDALRELCQKICNESVTIDNGEVVTRLEVILRDWSESKEVQKQIALVQYGFGKPVDRIETNLEPKTVLRLHFAHEEPGWQPPADWANHRSGRVFPKSLPDSASNGEGTRRPLLPDAPTSDPMS